MTKNELIEMMKAQIVEVVFEKVDGTLRTMEATLCEEIVPDQPAKEGEVNRNRKPNESVQVVWDAGIQQWRTFRWASVKKVNGTEFVHGA
jgi:hypothetical protein